MSRPVKRVQYTWKVLWDSFAVPSTISAAGGATASSTIQLITQAELEDLDDSAKVKRVVGEIYWFAQAQDGSSSLSIGMYSMGIVVNTSAVQPSFTLSSPSDAQDNPWAWLRNYMFTGSAISNEGGNVINQCDAGGLVSAHVDIPVNRRLGEGDRLLLVDEGFVSGGVAWHIFRWRRLRILVES